MPTRPLAAKALEGKAAPNVSPQAKCALDREAITIPPPIPTAKATLSPIQASLELALAQAGAGLLEDADEVQARMRAKYGGHGKGGMKH